MTEKGRKDKNQNIQVSVRLRPLNQRERDIKSLGIVDVVNNSEVVIRTAPNSSFTKKFTFDRAFGPNATQVEVYQNVVSPLIEEVLAGYNCTVFAYGQTGTGKTHTMVGENTSQDTTWQNDPLAGIIPRALSQLFDELRISNTEYTVRVSYLELYNEELFDLLSTDDNSKLRIYEDVTRKGSNIVNGLEEITVHNKNEVYQIMAQGQERKRVASTQMNAQSSRSHTVFTIVVHMKEISPQGEELVKIGKLNLVDLAGSENISKAGSDNPAKKERARECVNINQSLLTLGRVITALVERHPHIPYRESKLTRILQESLGGRTKTSIIATISPGHKDLEETMSTLEYAHRAKNIQNKPEVNQKMTKRAILREYVEEIDKLKRDLQAARDKSGVYLSNARFEEMTLKEEEQRKEIQDLLLQKKAMEDQKSRMESVFLEMEQKLHEREAELNNTQQVLLITKEKLFDTKIALQTRQEEAIEQRHLVSELSKKQQQLQQQAKQLVTVADTATDHVHKLHHSIDRRKSLEASNVSKAEMFRSCASETREQLQALLSTLQDHTSDHCLQLEQGVGDYAKSTAEFQGQNKEKLESLERLIELALEEIKSLSQSSASALQSASVQQSTLLRQAVTSQLLLWRHLTSQCHSLTDSCLRNVKTLPVLEQLAEILENWQTSAENQLSTLQSNQLSLNETYRSELTEVTRDVTTLAEQATLEANNATNVVKSTLQELEVEKQLLTTQLEQQLSSISTEREETLNRLQGWLQEQKDMIQEERTLQEQVWRRREENLVKHVEREVSALEERLKKDVQDIEKKKKDLEEQIALYRIRVERASAVGANCAKYTCDAASRVCAYHDRGVIHANNTVSRIGEDVSNVKSTFTSISENVPRNVGQWQETLISNVEVLQETLQNEISSSLSSGEKQCEQVMVEVQQRIDDNVSALSSCVTGVVHKFQECSTSAAQTLSSAIAATATATTQAMHARDAVAASIHNVKKDVVSAINDAKTVVVRQSCIENEFFSEYKVYEATGQTPDRTQYKYPRQVVVSSPHERILERFRNARKQQQTVETYELDSDISRSGSESSLSGDSPVSNCLNPIIKSTSDADIYTKKMQNHSKENADRSYNFKRPSKLPAPLVHKNPLLERNCDK